MGKEVNVLFEESKDGIFKGHTANYMLVYCETDENLENEIKNVKCIKAYDNHILGKL